MGLLFTTPTRKDKRPDSQNLAEIFENKSAIWGRPEAAGYAVSGQDEYFVHGYHVVNFVLAGSSSYRENHKQHKKGHKLRDLGRRCAGKCFSLQTLMRIH